MFNAPHCKSCCKKEDKHGNGCNNPKCKEYYKLKGVKNTEQQGKNERDLLCISCGNHEWTVDDTGRCESCRRDVYEADCFMCDFD